MKIHILVQFVLEMTLREDKKKEKITVLCPLFFSLRIKKNQQSVAKIIMLAFFFNYYYLIHSSLDAAEKYSLDFSLFISLTDRNVKCQLASV